MYLTIKEPARQAFLAALAKGAETPFSLWQTGDRLDLRRLSPALIAAALSFGAFPAYERRQLCLLAGRRFGGFDADQRRELVRLALAELSRDVGHGTDISGPRRLLRLETRLRDQLPPQGGFDFEGFCRFRLPGHISYLNYVLDLAADELLAGLEDEEYYSLLSDVARPYADQADPARGPRLRLEFMPQGLFALRREGAACRLEAGCWSGREDMLLANLLCERPAALLIEGAAFAPLSITSVLEQVLGEKISYAPGAAALDKPTGGCYDE